MRLPIWFYIVDHFRTSCSLSRIKMLIIPLANTLLAGVYS